MNKSRIKFISGILIFMLLVLFVATIQGYLIKAETPAVTGNTFINNITRTKVDTNIKPVITKSKLSNHYWSASSMNMQWVDHEIDGTRFVIKNDRFILSHVENPSEQILATRSDLNISYNKVEITPDLKGLLISVATEYGWRYSKKATYYLYNIETKQKSLLSTGKLSLVEMQNSFISFVKDNDLYVYINQTEHRVTNDGSENVINGMSDWVYEEEILLNSRALWISNDNVVAWLKFNDTNVNSVKVPYYHKHENEQYPINVSLKYPKPGTTNPTVELWVYRNMKAERINIPTVDCLVTQVTWVGSSLLVRVMNRVQDEQWVYHVTWDPIVKVNLTRHEKTTDDGWYLHLQPATIVSDGYIELAEKYGYTQLVYYKNISEPGVVLTRLDRDVLRIVKVYKEKVYFLLAEQNGSERHLYEIGLDGNGMKPVLAYDSANKEGFSIPSIGYYDADFSPKASYFQLSYLGPDIPWEIIGKVNNPTKEPLSTRTNDYQHRINEYEIPKIEYIEIRNNVNDIMNAKIIYPPNFDKTKKYPVMMEVYGGPGSQKASKVYSVDFMDRIALLNVIVLIVDGRGTGSKGRKYLTSINKNLGEFETQDQITAAKYISKMPFVDSKRIGIWGWSYGGFVTAKVIEANSGVFSLGVSVAPVTNWLFYDSVYTERYLKTPQENPQGYLKSKVTEMNGFKNAKFLLAHGTADDNVHVQNSWDLVWHLTESKVKDYEMHIYPDSNHNINKNGARAELYDVIESFICRNFQLDCLN